MSSVARFTIIGVMLFTVMVLGIIVVNQMRPASVAVVQAPPAPLMVNQLVAARPIPAGTLARDEDFTAKQVPAISMATNHLTDTPDNRANLRGALIRQYLDAGSPVSMTDVLQPRDRGFIASVLPEGYRAVAIGVDAVSGVAGLIWPGDHVDVILTHEIDGAVPGWKAMSETVMTDVRVIAIDQDMVQSAPNNNAAAGKVVRTVTLEVNPVQAQKVTVAHNLGKLSLSIRSAMDQSNAAPGAVYGKDVSPALAGEAQPTGRPMQIYNGKDHKEIVFR